MTNINKMNSQKIETFHMATESRMINTNKTENVCIYLIYTIMHELIKVILTM